MARRNINTKPFLIGPLLVRRVLSRTVAASVRHDHYWRGYLCPTTVPPQQVGRFGKPIEVRSMQQLHRERDAYRAEVDPAAEGQLAYYEVVDTGAKALGFDRE